MNSFIVGLLLLASMNAVANLYIPVPLTPTTLWMGQFHHPFVVIIVSTISNVAGWMLFNRYLYKGLNKYTRLISKLPKSYFNFFGKRTLLWVFIINSLPFPVDFIRLIAIANQCPPTPLTWAIGCGRLVRNTLLVFLGAWLFQYQYWFIGILAFLFLIPLLASGITFLRQKMGKVPEITVSEILPGDPQPDLL